MPQSETLIAALKFKGGVIIGSDSQTSDSINAVRWPTEKPQQIGKHPLIVATSGAGGRGRQAVKILQDVDFKSTTFDKADRVIKMVHGKLKPIYEELKNDSAKAEFRYANWKVALTLLGAYWAEGKPQILECSENGDFPYPHNYFHAVGSAVNTAYAVFRTLGGNRLVEIDEPLAILAILRILRTAVNVEMAGVSEPFFVWVIKSGATRKLTHTEINSNMELVAAWEREDQDNFLARRVQLED